MKKKNQNEDSENEFEVDEPDELQENSEEDWAPAKKGGKRPSTGKRGAPKKKKKGSSDDEEDDDDEETSKKKRGVKAKTPVKGKSKVKVKKEEEEEDEDLIEEEIEDEELEEEEIEEEEEDEDEEETPVEGTTKVFKEFASGSFVVLKSDFHNSEDPPIWKIDGKALLQKYAPFERDGKTLYKNTSVYSGWTINNKEQYYPATVVFKQQNRKEHVVEFQRDLIQKEETATSD